LHRYVDGRRNLQITLGDFYSCLRQHGRLLRVADQDPHGLFTAARLFAERAFDPPRGTVLCDPDGRALDLSAVRRPDLAVARRLREAARKRWR
jgi:hypothetical protein